MLHSTERIVVSRKLKLIRITVKTVFGLKIKIMPSTYYFSYSLNNQYHSA